MNGWAARARQLAGLGVSLAVLAGCVTPPAQRTPAAAAPPSPVNSESTTPADPGAWVGRWHAAGGDTLDIHGVPEPDTYDLVFHRQNRVDVTHRARATGGRLFYQAGTKHYALNAATGQASPDPAQRALTYCLFSAPEGTTYCRRRDSADALALRPGAYVAIRQDCDQADRHNTVIFDGQTLRRPGQSACTTRTLAQHGMIYSLQASCIGAGDTPPGLANLVIETPDEQHIALTPGDGPTRLYRHCATRSLPGPIQTEMP